MRQCCGYYCAMIAIVGIFFYAVIIVMEARKNQFVLYKLQFPEEAKEFAGMTADDVTREMNEKADHKIIALIIAIVVSCSLNALLTNLSIA